MLTAEQNELLCRVGPRTAMGRLIRRYWLPVLRSDELEADGAPVRVRLLGEDLVAFRSTAGRVGLLELACPHRGASLFFGRNEEEGLRCAYHGWKFDCSGRCVDMPNVPRAHGFADKVEATAHPCVERNGVIWAYLGPAPPPPLPGLEPSTLAGRPIAVHRVLRRCNWVQALEGDLDASHLVFAHRRSTAGAELRVGVPEKYVLDDTEVGSSFAALVETPQGVCFWLISHFLFPCFTMVPTGGVGGHEISVRCWVPLDDEHTLFWDISVLSEAAEHRLEASACEYLPATSDPLSRFVPVRRLEHDYLLDRRAQRTASFMGLGNVTIEDMAVTESMGPICDRSREHLGFADQMIIRTRRRLLDAARELAEKGTPPPGVEAPEGYRRRAAKVILPRDADVFAAAQQVILRSLTSTSGRSPAG